MRSLMITVEDPAQIHWSMIVTLSTQMKKEIKKKKEESEEQEKEENENEGRKEGGIKDRRENAEILNLLKKKRKSLKIKALIMLLRRGIVIMKKKMNVPYLVMRMMIMRMHQTQKKERARKKHERKKK